jgi:hypothetical protein
MNHKTKSAIVFLLLLLAAALLTSTLSLTSVQAQTDQATVVVAPSMNGTTNPAPGTYNYSNNTDIVLTATPDTGYAFHFWIISGGYTPGHTGTSYSYIFDPETGQLIAQIPHPDTSGIDSLVYAESTLNIKCGFGYTYTYQAVFTPTTGSTTTNNTATVVIQSAFGGTTTPQPGTYNYPNGTDITIQATPDPGYEFAYWTIAGDFTQGHEPQQVTNILDEQGNIIATLPNPSTSGIDSLVFTQNPATITCGYGYTFYYQPVFSAISTSTPTPSATTPATSTPATATPTPVATATPSPSSTTGGGTDYTMWIIIAAVVIIVVIVVVVAIALRRR